MAEGGGGRKLLYGYEIPQKITLLSNIWLYGPKQSFAENTLKPP